MKIAQSVFQLGNGFERIMFFVFSSLIVIHICSCMWIFFSSEDVEYRDMDHSKRYLTAFYFITTTFSTVGYGDISASNGHEMIFCIIIMILGVTAFAAGTGELTNLLSTYDHENSLLQEQIQLLNRLQEEYCLPLTLYENTKQSICYQNKTDMDQIMKFIDRLPNDLRVEMSFFVFEKTFQNLSFFKGRSISFIAWICPLLKSLAKSNDQYIFFEEDDVRCIYFLK